MLILYYLLLWNMKIENKNLKNGIKYAALGVEFGSMVLGLAFAVNYIILPLLFYINSYITNFLIKTNPPANVPRTVNPSTK